MSKDLTVDMQSTNLYMLQAVRHVIHVDPAAACCKFGLNAALLEHLRTVSQDRLWSFVSQVETSLFLPREDLIELMNGPPALASPLAMARPARPTPPTPPTASSTSEDADALPR